MAALVEVLAADPGAVPFAIVARETGEAVGFCSLLRIDPTMGSIEVGGIAFGRQLQRSRAATESMYLLMRHVFDDLGYRRYEWKCDSLNGPSRRGRDPARLHLGGQVAQRGGLQGPQPRHRLVLHHRPRVAAREEGDARTGSTTGNFDAAGRQRVRLAARPAEQATQQEQ